MKTLCMAAALLLIGGSVSAQATASLPAGVTPATVSTGEALFKSVGLCFACHGMDAKGLPGVGANLTDDKWLHNDGTFESILQQILEGVPPGTSESGAVMPPKGGSVIDDGQARAIAAYVWSLSHGRAAVEAGG